MIYREEALELVASLHANAQAPRNERVSLRKMNPIEKSLANLFVIIVIILVKIQD